MGAIFVTHDYETTGLPVHRDGRLSQQPRAIEFAAILTDGKEIIDTMEFICNPGIQIEPIITQITGLTNKDLEDKPPFSHFVPQLKTFFSRATHAVAHNLSFDYSITEFDLRRLDLTMEDVCYPPGRLCTVEQLFPLFGHRVKLQDWWEMRFGKYEQKHRALDDVKLLHQLCIHDGIYSAIQGGFDD